MTSGEKRMGKWFGDHGRVRFKRGQTCFSCGHEIPCNIEWTDENDMKKCWHPSGTVAIFDEVEVL